MMEICVYCGCDSGDKDDIQWVFEHLDDGDPVCPECWEKRGYGSTKVVDQLRAQLAEAKSGTVLKDGGTLDAIPMFKGELRTCTHCHVTYKDSHECIGLLRAQLAAAREELHRQMQENMMLAKRVADMEEQLAAVTAERDSARKRMLEWVRRHSAVRVELAEANERLSHEQAARATAWENFDKQRQEWVTTVNAANDQLGNLLAVIHGDGGHYQCQHGTAKAAKDAEAKYIAATERAETAERELVSASGDGERQHLAARGGRNVHRALRSPMRGTMESGGMTVIEHIRAHCFQSLGIFQELMPSLDEIKEREWCPEFIEYMRNRLIVGRLRYGSMHEPGGQSTAAYMASITKRCRLFIETGNEEYLVDVANLALVEYTKHRHPNRHFRATDGSDRVGIGSQAEHTPKCGRCGGKTLLQDDLGHLVHCECARHMPEAPRLSMTREEMDKFLEENHKRVDQWPNSMVQEGDAP